MAATSNGATVDPATEWKIVGPLLDTPLVLGERRFLISSRWLSAWKAFASPPLSPLLSRPPRPGPIDNTDLVLPDGELRTVFHHFDFEIVSAAAWEQLRTMYGGGPPLKRRVIASGITQTTLEVDVTLRKFLFVLATPAMAGLAASSYSFSSPKLETPEASKPVVLFFSRRDTLRHMRDKACKKLGITDAAVVSRARIYNSYGGHISSELTALDDTIERSILVPGQTIVVDTENHVSATRSPVSYTSPSPSLPFTVPPISSSYLSMSASY